MRPTNMRWPRTVRLTAGALAIVAPTSAVALAAGPPDAQTTLQITPASSRLDYGQALTVTGLAPSSDGGQRLALEYSAAGSPWRALAHTEVHSDGAFRLHALLTRSGAVRVAAVPAARATAVPAVPATAVPAVIAASPPQHVAVAAKLVASTGTIDALSGQELELRGMLLPRQAGRRVRLQVLARGSWRTLAVARTGAGGRFVLRYAPGETGRRLRQRRGEHRRTRTDPVRAGSGVLVRRRRQHCLWLPRGRRDRQQGAALWHQGHHRLPRPDRQFRRR